MSYGNYGAFTPVKFSLKMVETLYNKCIYKMCTNTKYEGEIKKEGDSVVVRTAGKITMKPYTKGMQLVSESLTPTKETMVIDQAEYFKFEVDDIDEIQNDIDAIATYAENAKEDMQQVLDLSVLDYAYKNVDGDNLMGTDYSTGTVAVNTSGAVTGSGTVFTDVMVGALIKVVGHTKYYLVSARTSNTAITITEQNGTAYQGGTIAGGSTFIIKGATPLVLTKANVYEKLVDLGTLLDEKNTPEAGRFLVINAKLKGLIRKSPEFIPAIETAYAGVIKKGHLGELGGFQILVTENVRGDNTNGFYFWAGTPEFMTFAAQIIKTSVIPSSIDPNSFVGTCKGLLVWGREVFDGNRGRAAIMRATVTVS